MVLFSALIFLNFIIAEVSNSYKAVRDKIDSLVFKERAGLIEEVEEMIPQSIRDYDKKRFPKYIVVREQEV